VNGILIASSALYEKAQLSGSLGDAYLRWMCRGGPSAAGDIQRRSSCCKGRHPLSALRPEQFLLDGDMFGSAVTGAGRAWIMTGFLADGFSARDPLRCGSKVVGNGGPAVGFGSEVIGDSAPTSDLQSTSAFPTSGFKDSGEESQGPPAREAIVPLRSEAGVRDRNACSGSAMIARCFLSAPEAVGAADE